MSQLRREEIQVLILVIAIFFILGLLGIGAWWSVNHPNISQVRQKSDPSPKVPEAASTSSLPINSPKVSIPNQPTNTPEAASTSSLPINSPKVSIPTPSLKMEDRISFGEKILIPKTISSSKQAGVDAIAVGNFKGAIPYLEKSRQDNPNDPEALIYLNNARIDDAKTKSYTVAVPIPISNNNNDLNYSLEILRGVAQAQDEINHSGGIRGVFLKIAIASDDNKPEVAKQIAGAFVKNPDVLGVVGHYTSDVTLAAGRIYDSEKLVAITFSSSVQLSNYSHYIFRIIPSDYTAARSLADYMLVNLQLKNAVVFFDSQSNYSQSLKSEFVKGVLQKGGQILSEFDLSSPNFNPASSLRKATTQGAQVIMLAANTNTLNNALKVLDANKSNTKPLKVLGGDDVYTLDLLRMGKDAALEMVLAVPWHIDSNPKSDFPLRSKRLWRGDVSWRTALAHDATQALITAIESNPTRSGVQQALSSLGFSTTGATGKIRFSPSGDSDAKVQLVKVVTGKKSGTGYDFVVIK